MSALGRLLGRERRDYSPSWAIPSPSEGYWNASGYPVNTDSALRNAAFYACVSLIANSLATTPIDVYRKAQNRRQVVEPSPSLIAEPSPGLTQVEWLFSLITSLLVRGNTYGVKGDFDPFGYPRQIELAHPDEVSVRWVDAGRRQLEYRFNGQTVPLERVFHLKGFTLPGWVEGLSVVQHHAQTIGMGLAAGSFAAGFYQGGGFPAFALETDQPITEDQAKIVQSRVADRIRSHGREPVALGNGWSLKGITASPAEAQFLEAMHYTATDIARIFNVPAEKINAATEGKAITYGNREANVIEFQTDALLPWAVRIEQALTRLIPRGQFVKFNLDAAIRVDPKTRYEVHKLALDAKWKLPDEVRELEDMEPMPEQAPPEIPAPPEPEEGENQ